MRIVFDTNVLFSAFIAHGVCAGLYEECLQRAQIVVSPDILAELEDKLIAKAKLSAADSREVIRAVRADAAVVKAAPLPRPVCRDKDDDLILAVARAADADARPAISRWFRRNRPTGREGSPSHPLIPPVSM